MISLEAINRIAELGAVSITPKVHSEGGKPFVIIPDGTKAEDVSGFFPASYIRRSVSLLEADSFADYVNRFKTDDTLLFAAVTEQGCTLKAILDYHTAAPELIPHRCEHVASYATIETPEWKTWMAANRKAMSQVDFATWLEDNSTMFVNPKGADLLELVQTLVGKCDVRFVSGVRLRDGANRLNYEEDVILKGQSTTTSDAVDLPTTLAVGIAPFQGAPKYQITARLKFRIEGRKLSLWFETVAPHTIIRECVLAVVKQVAEKTGITPLLGNT